jgi:hypothetical protein
MKEAVLFVTDYLVSDPLIGWLISGPSNSPELGCLVMGLTADPEDKAWRQPERMD